MREDWVECELGEIADKITKGSTPTTYGYKFQESGINFIKIENVKNGKVDKKSIINFISEEAHNSQERSKLHTGDVLFSIAGTIGETCLVHEDILPANTNQAFAIINGFNEILLPNFLLKQLESFVVIKIKSKARGGAMNNVSLADLKKFEIILPPLPEQRAIVAKIEALFSDLDNGIADLKKAQEQLKIYRQAVLKKAFEGELTRKWREQQTDLPTAEELLEQIKEEREKHYNKQVEEWKQAVKEWEKNGKQGKKPGKPRGLNVLNKPEEMIHSLPGEWEWCKLGYIASKISDGPFGSNLKTADYVKSGIRVIRLENIGNLKFKNKKKSFISEEKYESIKNHCVYPNDIIFSSFIVENVSVAAVPKEIKLAINKADCFCVRFNHLVYFKYFEYFLSTRTTYNQLINEVHGATRPRINTTQLKEVLVPICTLEEQHQIVREIETRLSVCDKLEQSITEAMEKADALRQSILKKAFQGNLLNEAELKLCREAPDYEPADVLLARIQQSRNKVTGAEKGGN